MPAASYPPFGCAQGRLLQTTQGRATRPHPWICFSSATLRIISHRIWLCFVTAVSEDDGRLALKCSPLER